MHFTENANYTIEMQVNNFGVIKPIILYGVFKITQRR